MWPETVVKVSQSHNRFGHRGAVVPSQLLMASMIIVEIVFSLYFDENNEF